MQRTIYLNYLTNAISGGCCAKKRAMLEMFVFDMAGTVVDENNVVYKTLHRAVAEAGHEVSWETVLLLGAGKEKLQALEAILEGRASDQTAIRRIFERFQILLKAAYADLEVRPQPGSEAIFEWLRNKGIRVVLNTGYNRMTAEGLLEKLGWETGRDIDLLVTADQVTAARPAPDMITHAMAHFGVTDPARVAKIGDSIIDIEEGRNAGCGLVLGVTTGAHTRAQLSSAQPDGILDHLDEIRAQVEAL